MNASELQEWLVELHNCKCSLQATWMNFDDYLFLTSLLPRTHNMGTGIYAAFDKAVHLTHFSADLHKQLRETDSQDVIQYMSLASKNSTGSTELTHLQTNSSHPSQNNRQFKRQKRSTCQSNNSGGAQQQLPRREKCSRCGLKNHVEENCRFLARTCPICKQVGHRPSVCPSKPPKQQQSNNKRRRPSSTPPFTVIAHPVEDEPFHLN